MSGLWRNNKTTKGGKYLVQRRDGTVPEWPYMVFGAKDPAAQIGLLAYADEAERLGYEPQYVADVRALADDFGAYRAACGDSDPTSGPDRHDDPEVVAKMLPGRSA